MITIPVEDQIAEINRKLDNIGEELAKQSARHESLADLSADLQLIGRELYEDAVARAGKLEQKGYFQFAGKASGILDALVTSHSPQDLEQAQASIPHLVGFLRQLTRPEVLQALEVIVHGFGEVQAAAKNDVSGLQLLRQLNAPAARRGLATIIKFLGVVGASTSSSGAPNGSKPCA
jgi:hypothetical protein